MSICWENMCCLCAGEDNCGLDLLNNGEDFKDDLIPLISKYLSITIKLEKCPMLCGQCSNKIIDFHQFALKCKETQIYLEQLSDTALLPDVKQDDVKTITVLKTVPVTIKEEIDNSSDDDAKNSEDFIPLADFEENRQKVKSKSVNRKRLKRKCTAVSKQMLEEEIKQELSDRRAESVKSLINTTGVRVPDEFDSKTLKYVKHEETFKDEDMVCGNQQNGCVATRKDLREENDNIFLFYCNFCDSEFSNWNSLKLHSRRQHKCKAKATCICSKTLMTSKSVQQHMLKHNPASVSSCETCGKIFSTPSELSRHSISHIPKEELPFVCCTCAKGFATARILKVHERIHTPKELRYKWPCPNCELKFTYKSGLATHVRAVHDKMKPFVCDLCGHPCSTKGNLEVHRIRHGTVKNFICEICDKGFKTKGSLQRHMDIHSDAVYQCPQCPVLLNSKMTLRNHLYVHDESKHICPFCKKAFKRRKDIKSHLKLHTGEQPYSCPWCQKTFTSASNCRIHKRRMHPNEFKAAEETKPFAPVIGVKSHSQRKVIRTKFKVLPRPSKCNTSDLFYDQAVSPDHPNDQLLVDSSVCRARTF